MDGLKQENFLTVLEAEDLKLVSSGLVPSTGSEGEFISCFSCSF
jgi:hypothetical protein